MLDSRSELSISACKGAWKQALVLCARGSHAYQSVNAGADFDRQINLHKSGESTSSSGTLAQAASIAHVRYAARASGI